LKELPKIRVFNILFYGLNSKEFESSVASDIVKEVWDTLEMTHEGTS